jgi:dTDP-4-dehydrorhamnose reductase
MNLLIVGGGGQLGRELVEQSRARDFIVIAPTKNQMNITNIGQVRDIIEKHQPFLVINAAAYTNVDKAETEQTLAFAVNQSGPANLARTCAGKQIPLIHLSTDYVFSGRKGAPYKETDPVSPLGVYGQSKAAGESAIRSFLSKHLIVRTSWLYGIHGHNFVKTILTLAQQRDVLRVVADQYGSPTSGADLAEALVTIAERWRNGDSFDWGTYHYCGKGITTWHAFAEKILEFARPLIDVKATRIEPIQTADYPTKAQRPVFSALDCLRMQKKFKIEPRPWQESLKIAIDTLCIAGRRLG